MAYQKKRQAILDTVPNMTPAGVRFVHDGESAAACLKPTEDAAAAAAGAGRPVTPEEQKKFRKSYKLQPGLHCVPTGMVGAPLPPAGTSYGVRTNIDGTTNIAGTSAQARDALTYAPITAQQQQMLDAKESIYKSHVREPLGRSFHRPGHVLPQYTADPKFRFGVTSSSSESAKNLLNLGTGEEPSKDEHEITRQANRQYNWSSAGIDPNTHRFGLVVRDEVQGVAKTLKAHTQQTTTVIARAQADFNLQKEDQLGRSKPKKAVAHLPPDHTFGVPISVDEWPVRKVIQGTYSAAQQQPDADLGISRRLLSRHEQVPAAHKQHRVFGTPSIRFDKPVPAVRSVADTANYGNESDSKGLLYPKTNVYKDITVEDFKAPRSAAEVKAIFQAIGESGAVSDDAKFKAACDEAVRSDGVLSVDSFRHALNRAKFTAACGTCQRLLCVHSYCKALACSHGPNANHAPHASHQIQTQTYNPTAYK